ncbi:MAG: nucleotidyltransferase domain-containing protein [Bacteroidota bacterium]
MTKEEILHILQQNKDILKKFKVKKIGIFGSAVKNELNKYSDIDFVVEFEQGEASIKNFGGLVLFLENTFHRPVDLLTIKGVENIRIKSIKHQIMKSIEYAY